MKTVCILTFLFVATTYANTVSRFDRNWKMPVRMAPSGRKLSPEALECAKELHTNLNFLENVLKLLKAGKVKPWEDLYNILACVLSKQTDAALGDTNIHDSFIRQVIEVDEEYNIFKNKPFTRQDLENVGNECARKGLDNVGYLKCIKILEPPFVSVLLP